MIPGSVVRLGEIVQIRAPLILPDVTCDADLPCFGPEAVEPCTGAVFYRTTVQESQPRSVKFRYSRGDVIYSKIRPYLAKAMLAFDEGYISADMYPLSCGREILPNYLLYELLSERFTEYAIAHSTRAQMPKLNREALFAYRMRLPPLAEQRRIVDLLERAAGIRRLREQALAKARTIVPALFLDMFGDPATNPKGWPVTDLGSTVAIRASLQIPNLVSEALIPCFGPEAIESRTGRVLNRTTVSEAIPRSGKYRYASGDVIYSKIRPYLAKAMIAIDSGYISADMYPLTCKSIICPYFLLETLLSSAFTKFATTGSTRAQMPKLNRETLFAYCFPLPPISLQESFAAEANNLRSIVTQQEHSLATALKLERSLMAQLLG